MAIFNPKAELPEMFEYVDLESVVGTEMLSHKTESKRTAPSRAQRLAQTGDLFYQTVRPYQKNNYLFEKPDRHYVFSTGYAQMRPVVYGRFLLCLVQSERFVKVVLDNCTGTSYPAINSNDLAEINVYSPGNPQEQKQIGDFFKGIDNLITLHQRKLHKYKQFLSFYTFSWEQRKVTEIGKIFIGLVTTMTKHYTDKGSLLIRNSDIKDGCFEFGNNPIYLDDDFSSENSTRMHKVGDVVTVHTGDVGTSAVITEKEANSIGFATIVTRPYPEIIDPNYLSVFLNTETHKRWAVAISTGDGRTNYNLGDYYNLIVPIPTLSEQRQIANYISSMNNLITLHQRKEKCIFIHSE